MVRKKEDESPRKRNNQKSEKRPQNRNNSERNLERGMQNLNITKKKAENRQTAIEQIKNAARKKFNNEKHKVVLIKYSEKMTRDEINILCQGK